MRPPYTHTIVVSDSVDEDYYYVVVIGGGREGKRGEPGVRVLGDGNHGNPGIMPAGQDTTQASNSWSSSRQPSSIDNILGLHLRLGPQLLPKVDEDCYAYSLQ